MAAKISVRKMGTRRGEPHYGATCQTCGTVLVVAHASKDTARAAGEAHKITGCAFTLQWATSVGR